MIRITVLAIFLATGAWAQSIDLSAGGIPAKVETSPAGSVRLPTSAWSPDGEVGVREGALRRTAYQFPNSTRTTLQLIEPARTLLEEEGYTTVFGCADAACGGFDFRFQLDLLPEPEMHVDLGDFRYLLVESNADDPQAAGKVSLVVSRDTQAGYVHITEVFATNLLPQDSVQIRPVRTTIDPGGLVDALETTGHAVLPDLEFGSGASDLGDAAYQSLTNLAAWLAANPTAEIAIVGHTDAVGGLAANTALSKRRAESVRNRLANTYGANPAQMQSDGVGYLAPIASNLTEEGRAQNRRVEVILLSN